MALYWRYFDVGALFVLLFFGICLVENGFQFLSFLTKNVFLAAGFSLQGTLFESRDSYSIPNGMSTVGRAEEALLSHFHLEKFVVFFP